MIVTDRAAHSTKEALARRQRCGPTILCANEPAGGAVVDAMTRVCTDFPEVLWLWCPNAEPFDIVAVNDDDNTQSVRRRVTYAELDTLIVEMIVFSLAANAVPSADALRRLPRDAFVMAVDPTSRDSALQLCRWRTLQESRLLFSCVMRPWNAAVFPDPAVYRWRGGA